MQNVDLVYKQREAAHKFASSNPYPPFKWEVISNNMKIKNTIPQGNIRYTFFDDDNNLNYEGDIRIIQGEDGLVRQDIDFKLVEGQYEDVVNSFNIYRLYSTQIAIGYWICDKYQYINIICLRGYGEKAEIRAKLAARYWKKILGIDATPGKFEGKDVLEVKFNMPEPYFYPTDNIPVLQEIKSNFKQIKKEVISFLKNNEFYDYPNYEINNEFYSGPIYHNDWKAIPLTKFASDHIELHDDNEINKHLTNILNSVKTSEISTFNKIIKQGEEEGWIRNAFVSKLKPGSVIEPHKGWSHRFLRCHIGIEVDEKCKITKSDPLTKIKKTKTWKEGEWLAFKDGGNYYHSVEHKGEKHRIVISIDLDLDHIFNGHYLKYASLPQISLPFKFTTTIVKGVQIDSIIGLPSANLKDKPNLRCGIYTVNTNYGEGVLSNYDLKSTVFILNFDKEIYGKEITITNPKLIDKKHKFANPLLDFYNEFCDECKPCNLPITLKNPFTTTIVKGLGRGTGLEFPTANLKSKPNLKCGFYLVNTNFGEGLLMHYDTPKSIISEVNIFNFDKDIYGKSITISDVKLLDQDGIDLIKQKANIPLFSFYNPLIRYFNKFCEKI